MRFGLIFSLLLAIIAVIFALQNPQPMDVNLLLYQTEGSTALILILTFGFGVLVGLLSSLPGRLRARRKLKELQQNRDAADSSSSTTATPDPESSPSETSTNSS